jgi:hypothetical protein
VPRPALLSQIVGALVVGHRENTIQLNEAGDQWLRYDTAPATRLAAAFSELARAVIIPVESEVSECGRLDEAMFHGPHCCARPVRHAELGIDVLDMVTHRLRTDPESASDALVG